MFAIFAIPWRWLNVKTDRIIIFVIPNLNIYLCAAMSFIHDIYELRKSFRYIEKITLRCVHLKNAIEFNETCLNNGIFPNYCQIIIRNIENFEEEQFEICL